MCDCGPADDPLSLIVVLNILSLSMCDEVPGQSAMCAIPCGCSWLVHYVCYPMWMFMANPLCILSHVEVPGQSTMCYPMWKFLAGPLCVLSHVKVHGQSSMCAIPCSWLVHYVCYPIFLAGPLCVLSHVPGWSTMCAIQCSWLVHYVCHPMFLAGPLCVLSHVPGWSTMCYPM